MLTVYLAGKMTGLTVEEMREWRIHAAGQLRQAGFRVYDPTEAVFPSDFTANEVVANNCFMIDRSDIILAEIDHDEPSIGTLGEIMYAGYLGKPVIVWGKNTWVQQAPWLARNTAARFNLLALALAYIIKNYWKAI